MGVGFAGLAGTNTACSLQPRMYTTCRVPPRKPVLQHALGESKSVWTMNLQAVTAWTIVRDWTAQWPPSHRSVCGLAISLLAPRQRCRGQVQLESAPQNHSRESLHRPKGPTVLLHAFDYPLLFPAPLWPEPPSWEPRLGDGDIPS